MPHWLGRVALEPELVEALDRRRRRNAEPGEDLRHRDSRLLLALEHSGPGQRRDIDRVQVAQSAEDEEAVAPVELLIAQVPFERHGGDAMAAARVEVVEHDAAEARARLGAGVAQRRVRRVAVGDVPPGMAALRHRIVVPRLGARQDAVVAVPVLEAQIAVHDLRHRSALVEVEVAVVLVAAGGRRQGGTGNADQRAVHVGQQIGVLRHGPVRDAGRDGALDGELAAGRSHLGGMGRQRSRRQQHEGRQAIHRMIRVHVRTSHACRPCGPHSGLNPTAFSTAPTRS